MKLLFASDIHGSALWCERLMGAIEQEAPDKVVLLGDLLYHGPRNPLPEGHNPKEVARMLNALAPSIVAVRGNCEAEVDQMVLDFPSMADYAPLMDNDRILWCTHGHLFDPDHLPPLTPGSTFIFGHTHVQELREQDGIAIVNPGSVSLPKDGRHGFAVYQNGIFELREI